MSRDWIGRVNTAGPISKLRPDLGRCWIWNGALVKGYGVTAVKIDEGYKNKYVHRLSYERSIGPIPEEFQIDHLCRVKSCCNPRHLETVTSEENMRRAGPYNRNSIWLNKFKTHCKNGHEFTVDNTKLSKAGARKCIECSKGAGARIKSYYAALEAKIAR